MYFSLPDSPCVVHPITILIWKDGFFCVVLGACSSHSTCGPTTWLQCVHASVHEFMSHWLSMSAPSPLKTFMETWGPLCGIVSLSPSLFFMTHLGKNVYMYQYMYLCPSLFPFSLTHLCIIIWNHGCPCVPLCDYSSNLTFGPTPWLKYVHASVHVLLSTWLLMSASPYLHTYVEKWVSLCGRLCVFQSSASGPTPCLNAHMHRVH